VYKKCTIYRKFVYIMYTLYARIVKKKKHNRSISNYYDTRNIHVHDTPGVRENLKNR